MRWLVGIPVALLLALTLTGLLYDVDPAPLRLPRATRIVDGTRLGYVQRGQGADVVLVHGGMGSAEDFEPVLDTLAAGFRVTAVDRPGFGASLARGDDPTYAGNARLLAGLVRGLGLVHPVIVGHSHGGGVALQLAETEPELVGGLVLLAPAAFPGDGPKTIDHVVAVPYLGEGVIAWIGGRVGPTMIASILEPMIAPDRAVLPGDFVTYRQTLWTNPRSIAVHARQAVTDAAGLAAIDQRLTAIHAPTVIVACDQDSNEGGSVDSRRLARELPGSTLRWLEGCGHYVQYRHPEAVIAAIKMVAAR